MMRREQLRHCFLCGVLLRLVEAADKYFIQGNSKSFRSLEDIASISFKKKKKYCSRLRFVQKQKRGKSKASSVTENKSKCDLKDRSGFQITCPWLCCLQTLRPCLARGSALPTGQLCLTPSARSKLP